MRLLALALHRLVWFVPTLLGLLVVTFVISRVVPADPVALVAGETATPAQVEALRHDLGFDRPLPVQFVDYLARLARGDMGVSLFTRRPILDDLAHRLPATIELTVVAMLIAVLIGMLTGILAALRRGTWIDTATRTIGTVSFSLPWFALGVLGIVVFGVWLRWLPVIGRLPNALDYHPLTNFVLLDAILQDRPELIWPWIEHLILPATTLALSMAGFITRIVRASVLEVLGDDFVRTARMKGLSPAAILRRHVLRNSSLPIVTVLGLQFGSLLGGSVITETVFSYPGVGNLLVNGILQRDYPIVQGAALAIALLFTLVNVVVDLLYLALDPRLRKA